MESSGKQKGYRFVSLQQYSPSFLMNNLASNGEYFVFANSTESAPKALIYTTDILEKDEVTTPQIS